MKQDDRLRFTGPWLLFLLLAYPLGVTTSIRDVAGAFWKTIKSEYRYWLG